MTDDQRKAAAPEIPVLDQNSTASEHSAILSARASRARCRCGEAHEDGQEVTPP